jgi:enoyl-CoA hydratase/carnithine racemase
MSAELVRYSVWDKIAEIMLDRPPVNALSMPLIDALLAAKSPIVMKIGRDAFMRAVDADFRRSVENAAESFALVATTEDCQEGLNAFVEKRTPNYRGR